ncbi:MAG: 3-oxoacyl-[acyl-carrier-protein] reductase [Deltaproteobacteria bacterium]|nr:3-oxoacyl-[acyl-carrier-protein] reductase [Deltaproteobacteria bacterium]
MRSKNHLFSGKVALVTGAAQGIGRAVALMLAEEGADVAVNDIQKEKGEDVVATIKRIGRSSIFYEADVSSFRDCEKMIDTVVKELGGINILINNAGIVMDQLLIRMSEDEWDRVNEVNLKGVFNCCKAALRYMSRQKEGKIISITSVAAQMGNIGQANYSASKAGIIGLTKSLAREFASRNININAIAPGFINTDMTKNIPEKAKQYILSLIPMERFGEVEHVTHAVRYLASSASDYITGQVINVNGGIYM